MMSSLAILAASEIELVYVWNHARPEAKAIILILLVFSVFAWSVMASKALQMRRARQLNRYFETEFRAKPGVLAIFDRRLQIEGCPLFSVYESGCLEMDSRLGSGEGRERRKRVSLTSMEHVKRSLESAVAREALRLESGLILLAIAVSGAPFLGLLGTVWGVMSTFAQISIRGQANLEAMSPGVSAALVTTVAGLLVAIPSMFGYNWLVHNLRVLTVEMDNFAQDLVSRMEREYLPEEEPSRPPPYEPAAS
jgi:biopolymer transport protein ExbB/TolQ